jgi:hypothetical protein
LAAAISAPISKIIIKIPYFGNLSQKFQTLDNHIGLKIPALLDFHNGSLFWHHNRHWNVQFHAMVSYRLSMIAWNIPKLKIWILN